MHALAATHNGIGRASADAQRATDAPVFINHGHDRRPFAAASRVNLQTMRPLGLLQRPRNAGDAFVPAWRALVDGRIALRNRLGISGTIGLPQRLHWVCGKTS